MRYDVIDEPCVPVVYTGVKEKLVSIRRLFKDAHKIKGIYANSVLEEYGMKRILIAMFMDAYKIKDNIDLLDILKLGKFDISVFDSYVTNCRKLGDVFNLYDEKYPFLQWRDAASRLSTVKADKVKKIDALYWDVINENVHGLKHKVDSPAIFRGLCAYNVFLANKNGSGYPSNINGSAPFYLWIKSDSVFKEFVLNAVSESDWSKTNLPYGASVSSIGTHWTITDEPLTKDELTELYTSNSSQITKSNSKVLYNNRELDLDTQNNVINGYSTLSLLEGLTYQGKGFLVLPKTGPNNQVTDYDVYYRPVYKFSDVNNLWRDPFCAYKEMKDKKTNISELRSLKPVDYNYLWIDLLYWLYGDAGNHTCIRPLITEKFDGFALSDSDLETAIKKWGLDRLEFIVYAASANGGKYLWMDSENIELHASIFRQSKHSSYRMAVQVISDIAKIYKKGIKNSALDYRLLDMADYYRKARQNLDTTFTLALLNSNNLKDVMDGFYKDLLSYADECYVDSFKNYLTGKKAKKYKDKESGISNVYESYYKDREHLKNIVRKNYKIS